jgi:hypothetical protein
MRNREFAGAASTCRRDSQLMKYYTDQLAAKQSPRMIKISMSSKHLWKVVVKFLRRIRRCCTLQKTSTLTNPSKLKDSKASTYHVHYDTRYQQRDEESSEESELEDVNAKSG